MAQFFGTGGNDNFVGTVHSDLFDMSNGGDDTVDGGRGDDTFYFGGSLTAADTVTGGRGTDTLVLSGDYSAGLTLGPATISDIEWLTLTGGNDYSLTLDDANVTGRLVIDALGLGADNGLHFDGSAETSAILAVLGGSGRDTIITGGGNDLALGAAGADTIETGGGRDTIAGGAGLDLLNGGAGRDVFVYTDVSQSTNQLYDTIEDFFAGRDHIDLNVGIDAMDAQIETGSLSDGPTYVSDFETTVNASRLAAHHAVVWIPTAGTDAGDIYVVADANGEDGFQAGQDYIIELEDPLHLNQLDQHTFI